MARFGKGWLSESLGLDNIAAPALPAGLELRPREAVQMAHRATFNLDYHAWGEPIVRTLAAASAKGIDVSYRRVRRLLW